MGPKRKTKSRMSSFTPFLIEQLSKEDPAVLATMPAVNKAVKEYKKKQNAKAQAKQQEEKSKTTQQECSSSTPARGSTSEKSVNVTKKVYRIPQIKKSLKPQKTYKIKKIDQPVSSNDPCNSSVTMSMNNEQATQSPPENPTQSPPENPNDNEHDETAPLLCDDYSSAPDSPFQMSVDADPVTSFQMELRKQKCLFAIDGHFINVALPDFDVERFKLTYNRYVIVSRRCFASDDDLTRWVYYCSCDIIQSNFVRSLNIDADINQDISDTCIHIKAVHPILMELDFWEEEEDPLAFRECCLQVNEISETSDKDKVLVVFSTSPGIVSYDGLKFYCHVCQISYCKHCSYLKIAKTKDDNPIYLREFLDKEQKPMSSEDKRKSLSSKRILFFPNDQMKKNLSMSPSEYLQKEEDSLICEDSATCCGEMEVSSTSTVILYTKGMSFECKVKSKACSLCGNVQCYDGLEQSILNMEKFLLHYSVLRDYMLHFLHGKSCTLHGFYEVFILTQKSSGNKDFKKQVSYNDFKNSWYSFLYLLDIDFGAGYECFACGKVPEVIVCDATSLGYQRKFAAISIQDSVQSGMVEKFSHHKNRNAICQLKLRKAFQKWVVGKFDSNTFLMDMGKLHRPIYNVIIWSKNVFGTNLPAPVLNLYKCLYSPSPVCSYFNPSEDDYELAMKMFGENVKGDSSTMKLIQYQLPLFFDILLELTIETSLPVEWKGLIIYLADKAKQPFKSARAVSTPSCDVSHELSWFPNLPAIRQRGLYQQDTVTFGKNECRKNYNGHPNLTSGIFTIYCPHGICFGFQVMDKEESPNIPFTIFKTRFQNGPKTIIYDNNCSLHNYCLNRDPLFFKDTKFLIDRFHWKNHTACAPGYRMDTYPTYREMNSQINEQQNAATKRLKTQLSYMRPDNFVNHCKFFIWYRNHMKNIQIKTV